jgi:hypothetical protein
MTSGDGNRAAYGCLEAEARGSYNRRYIRAPTRLGTLHSVFVLKLDSKNF